MAFSFLRAIAMENSSIQVVQTCSVDDTETWQQTDYSLTVSQKDETTKNLLLSVKITACTTDDSYELENKGPHNPNILKQIINVVNRLVGSDSFRAIDSRENEDLTKIAFAYNFNKENQYLSGTAPIDATVFILYPNGAVDPIQVDNFGNWESELINENLVDNSLNQIVIFNNIDHTVLKFFVEDLDQNETSKNEPKAEKLELTFENIPQQAKILGKVTTSSESKTNIKVHLVLDNQADPIIVDVDDKNEWQYIGDSLESNSKLSLQAVTEQSRSEVYLMTFYKNSMHFASSKLIIGTAAPNTLVSVITPDGEEYKVSSGELGEWEIDLDTSLNPDEAVHISVGDDNHVLTYTG